MGSSSEGSGRNQFAIIARVAVDLSSSTRYEDVYAIAIDALLDILPIDRASLLLFDESDVMRFVASRNLSQEYCEAVEGHSPWTRTTEHPRPIVVDDTELDDDLEQYREVFRAEGIRALAFIPLVSANGLIGKFMLYVNEPHRFDPDDINLAWAIATQVALAVERGRSEQGRSRLLHELRKERNTLRFLEKASELLTSTLEPDSILKTIALVAVPTISDWCVVDLLDKDGSIRRVAVAHKDLEKVRWAQKYQENYPPSTDPQISGVARVIQTGAPELYETITDEMLEQSASDEENLKVLKKLGIRSAMIVPLTARGHKVGAVTFVSCESDDRFDEDDLSLATDLAQRAALAVDNARLYEAEREAREEAERANRSKDDFLATLSHEMRTPLTSALGWARMLSRDELDPQTRQHATAAIYRSTQSQVRIVEDLLDVSRIIAGKMTIRRDAVDLRDVVEGAIDLLRSVADVKGVRLETDLLSIPVVGDEERLRQVFWNLLSNAVKFSANDDVVTVMMRRHGDRAEVEVADTGRGIDPEFIPHLFERFRQADSSTTRSFGGLGLGLSIVHHLVLLHEGSVNAASDGKDRGSSFTVSLPVATEEAGGPVSHPSAPRRLDLDGASILVVEDEVESRMMIETILRRAGASVRSAAAPNEARRMLKEAAAEMIISDIAMPEEDGLSFVRALRAAGDLTPALALTAYGRDGDERHIEDAGFDDLLRKPVDPDLLLKTVARLLGQ